MSPASSAAGAGTVPGGVELLDLLELECIEQDLYRANSVYHHERAALYGGQVAAQALLAAGSTLPDRRLPHSLHAYYLRKGDPRKSTLFKVTRDRDGRSFSARRVVAIQNGEVIFNLSASFQVDTGGALAQTTLAPPVPPPAQSDAGDSFGLFSLEFRLPPQPDPAREWPTRFWARVDTSLPDDQLFHASAVTYLSDFSHAAPRTAGGARAGSSIDHAVWFHRPVDANNWMLTDFVPGVAAHGRGWYTGSIFTPEGVLVASMAQEMLYR